MLFNHPIPWLPWSNYIGFFFLSLGVFLCTKSNKNYYFIGLIFGLVALSRQDFFIPIILSTLFFFIINYLKNKKINVRKNLNLISGFSTPLVIFFIQLLISPFNFTFNHKEYFQTSQF